MLVVESGYRAIAKYLIFMKMADTMSQLSCDTKHQVGAFLIKKDFGNIVSIGYNGPRPGAPNVRKSNESGKSGFYHAEHNCLMRANIPTNSSDYMLFCTLSPCEACAGDLAIKGIDTVLYKEKYETGYQAGYDAMQDSNIKVDSIWFKTADMFQELIQDELNEFIDGNNAGGITDEGVYILIQRHLQKFAVPCSWALLDQIDFRSWQSNYPLEFVKYLYTKIS